LFQYAQNIGMVDTDFEELVSDQSFIETCNFLTERSARQIHNTYQSSVTVTTKNDKIKTVLALINEL
jgi:hypothetical protein